MKAKKWLILILFIPCLVFAEKWKQANIEVTHEHNGTQVYVTDYNNKKLLAFESKIFFKHASEAFSCSTFYSGQQRDIVYMGYLNACNKNWENGSIYVNLTNSNISKNFINFKKGPSNYKERITLLYDVQTKIFSLIPMFEECKKPFTIQVDSNEDGPQLATAFLPNGNLFLEYADPSGKFHKKTIPIDYKKLYTDCKD